MLHLARNQAIMTPTMTMTTLSDADTTVGTKWKWVGHCLGSLAAAVALSDALHVGVSLAMDITFATIENEKDK